MKIFAYKYSMAVLLTAVCLSSCCVRANCWKKSQDVKQESGILRGGTGRCSRCARSKKFIRSRERSKEDKSEVKLSFKSYEEHVSEQDKKDIFFVVTSAAEKPSVALALSQQEIKSALQRLTEVHPLALLQVVFEEPSLLLSLRKMQERGWIWELFTTELNKTFSEAASQGVIKDEDVTSFAATLGLDSETVTSVVRGERWTELLDILISQPS